MFASLITGGHVSVNENDYQLRLERILDHPYEMKGYSRTATVREKNRPNTEDMQEEKDAGKPPASAAQVNGS